MAPIIRGQGFDVVGLDSDLYRRSTFLDDGLAEIPSIEKDFRDVGVEELEGVDAIIHLAALSNDPLGDLNPELTYDINHQGTVRLARLAKQAGVSLFLFSSSCSMYGASVGSDLLTEDAPFNPVTAYAHSKVLAERDLATLADDNFSPVFMRNTTAYGVSPRLRFDIVLNNLVAHAFTTGLVYVKSDGTPWRPIVHIEDISLAFCAVLRAPRELIHNQAFNVGLTEENFQIRQLADIVREVVPGSRVEYAADGGPDKRSYSVDFGKIFRVLPGFKPQWTARRGAEELYETYKRAGLRLDDFEGPRYRRIDQIKQLRSESLIDETLRWIRRPVSVQ
jgi:nucleoside-diphosphate-sugar epimerase